MKITLRSVALFAALLVCCTALRADVLVTTDPGLNSYVVRASGVDGYTAVVDRTDGHMRSLTVGRGEVLADGAVGKDPWDGFAPEQVGFMGVLVSGKPIVARSLPATVAAPRQDGASVVIAVTTSAGVTLTYRFEPQRFGISASVTADLALNWPQPDIDYHVGNRVIYGQADQETVDAAAFTAHPFGSKAVLAITPPPGKMILSGYLQVPLAETPLWISARPSSPDDNLPELKFAVFRQHDGDESTFWTPYIMDYAIYDRLLVDPGKPISATFQQFGVNAVGTRMKSPQAQFYALDITHGDPEWFRESRSIWPGIYPTIIPCDWHKLPTTLTKGIASGSSTGLAPGVYRVRLALADGVEPTTVADEWADSYIVVGGASRSIDIVTPENRTVFYRGESIPITAIVRDRGDERATDGTVSVIHDGAAVEPPSRISIPAVNDQTRRVEFTVATADLAPGKYILRLTANGESADVQTEIVDPVAPSPIAISENQLGGLPFGQTLMGSAFGGSPVDSLAHGLADPYADLQITSFREEMGTGYAYAFNQKVADLLDALHTGPAAEHVGSYDLRQMWMDGMMRQHFGYWQGIQARGLSFTKANTLPGTEDGNRQRLLSATKSYDMYPNFFGPQVDVDCAIVAADGWLNYGLDDVTARNAVQARAAAAQKVDFHTRYVTQLADAGNDPNKLKILWFDWLRSVWPRTDTRDRAMMQLLDPTISINANREYHHGETYTGDYPPDLYRGLDLTNVEAWGDAIDVPLFPDSWANLADASRRANGRTDQPNWIESQVYAGDVPGYLETKWWGILANGADGVGYAANVFGLRQYSFIEPHKPNFQRQTAAAMARMVHAIGPMVRVLHRSSEVALLFSRTQADISQNWVYVVNGRGNYPPFLSYWSLDMAGYQPDYLFEEQILKGDLGRYKVLYLTAQTVALPKDVQTKIDAWRAQGGQVVIDSISDAKLFPYAKVVATSPYDASTAAYGSPDWKWLDKAVAAIRPVMDPLVRYPGHIRDKQSVTYWFQSGQTRYLIALNESLIPVQTTVDLTQPLSGYDMLTGQRISTTSALLVDFRSTDARLYAFPPAAIAGVNVHGATTARAGEQLSFTAKLTSGEAAALDTIAPGVLRIRDASGRQVLERMDAIGPRCRPLEWDTARSQAPGTYTGVLTELISGRTSTFLIHIRPGRPLRPLVTQTRLPIAIEPQDSRALDGFWSRHDRPWSIVLGPAQQGRLRQAQDLAAALIRRGVHVTVWNMPTTIRYPIGYELTDEEQAARDQVIRGDAIGDRYYSQAAKFPYGEFWEALSGPAIYRNVIFLGTPGENSILDQYGPNPGAQGAASVQYGLFDGDYLAVFLAGWSDAELDRVIRYVEHPVPTEGAVQAEAARQAFKAGYLLSKSVNEPGLASPEQPGSLVESVEGLPLINAKSGITAINWEEQIGRPVRDIFISPDQSHVLAKQHGTNMIDGLYAPNGQLEHSELRPLAGGTPDDDVRGIDNNGNLLVDLPDGRRSALSTGGIAGKPDWPSLWQNADGNDRLFLEPYTTQDKGANGKMADITKHELVRIESGKRVLESPDLGDVLGGITASPNGKYIWESNTVKYEGHIGPQTVVMADAVTGKQLWTKAGWWIFSTTWSDDGEYLAVVRHYNNVDKHGNWAEPSGRCTISLVRAADGEVVAEGYPTTWVDHMLVASDDTFAVGVPAYMAPHIWLLQPEKDMMKVNLSTQWLYSVALSGDGKQLYSIDLAGTLRRQEPTGKTIWSSDILKRSWGAQLGIVQPFGDDLMVGTYTGRLMRVSGHDGHVIWQANTAQALAASAQ